MPEIAAQMTAQQIIDETVTFYAADPKGRRSVNSNDLCMYLAEDGRMCAVGRCLISPGDANNNATAAGLADLNGGSLDNLLLPRYRGHTWELWERLQYLHDFGGHWDWYGLTREGAEYVYAVFGVQVGVRDVG